MSGNADGDEAAGERRRGRRKRVVVTSIVVAASLLYLGLLPLAGWMDQQVLRGRLPWAMFIWAGTPPTLAGLLATVLVVSWIYRGCRRRNR